MAEAKQSESEIVEQVVADDADSSGPVKVKIKEGANGTETIHDGRYVFSWNPHSTFRQLSIVTTSEWDRARTFKSIKEVYDEWRTISNVEPTKPDGQPNRPLTVLTIEAVKLKQ